MCFTKLLDLFFRGGNSPVDLPHPEEPPDPTLTAAGCDINLVLERWLLNWRVPEHYHEYWKTQIRVKVYDAWPVEMLQRDGINADTPACAWEDGGVRHLAALAAWLNPGVIAHEQAHNSYALLEDSEKRAFAEDWPGQENDSYLRLLLTQRNLPYSLWGDKDQEMHAEIYRYLAEKMPRTLKNYYPHLF